MNLKSKTAIFYDNGLFVSFAEKLAEYFGKVKYYMPWKSGFPKSNSLIVGTGLKGVERVKNFFDEVDKADIIIFPDVYDGDLQEYLRKQGKRVWGGGKGDEMELNRFGMKKYMQSIGMPVQKVWKIKGLSVLRDFLKDKEDLYIKVSTTRGDFETFHHMNYKLSEPQLDELEHKLGAKKTVMEFIVEGAINDATEVGYDGWCIDGQYPQKDSLVGIEIKDCGYAGAIMPYEELPKDVKWVNSKLSPLMKKYGYRGFFSTEIRIGKDEKPYLIDPCCRCGSPPSELYQEMYDNFGEIIWNGAEGKIVDPHATCKYGVMAMIHSSWADKNWQAIHYPKSIEKWVKLRNKCVIDGQVYVVPSEVGLPEIGAVIGIGETLLEAISNMVEHSKQVEGYRIEIKVDAIPKAVQEFEDAQNESGMKFGVDPLPAEEEIMSVIS